MKIKTNIYTPTKKKGLLLSQKFLKKKKGLLNQKKKKEKENLKPKQSQINKHKFIYIINISHVTLSEKNKVHKFTHINTKFFNSTKNVTIS